MPKFSIIIPVYNVEKYIEKCITSVINQSYKDFEVIVVNDGTKDKSVDKIKDYPVKIITQKNKGLSAARNKGVEHAKGEYILFLDSDDYWDKDLLKEINKNLKNIPDIVRFQIREVYEDGITKSYEEQDFQNKTGQEAFETICNYHFVENAWCYAIKKEYYTKNKFQFKEETIHEDYGLIPLVIMKAKKVNSINYVGYNYLQRQGSIMSNKDYEKTKKKVNDFYNHYKFLKEEIDKTKLDSKVFKSFITNSMILKICELEKEDYKKYLKLLREEKVFNDLLTNSFGRKVKKILISISPKVYYKFMSK